MSKEERMEERYPCSWTVKQHWGKVELLVSKEKRIEERDPCSWTLKQHWGNVRGLVYKEERMEEIYPCSWTFKQHWGKGCVTALKVKADDGMFKSQCDS